MTEMTTVLAEATPREIYQLIVDKYNARDESVSASVALAAAKELEKYPLDLAWVIRKQLDLGR